MQSEGWAEILRLIGEYAGPTAMLTALPLIIWACVVYSPYYRATKRTDKDTR